MMNPIQNVCYKSTLSRKTADPMVGLPQVPVVPKHIPAMLGTSGIHFGAEKKPLRALRSSENLLSKSVDNGIFMDQTHRSLSGITDINFSGFLLKRSRRPVDSLDSGATDYSTSPGSTHMLPSAPATQDEHDLNPLSIPNPPQHLVQNEEKTTKQKVQAEKTEDSTDAFAKAMFGIDMSSLRTDLAPLQEAQEHTALLPTSSILPITPSLARSKPIRLESSGQQPALADSTRSRPSHLHREMSTPDDHPPDYRDKDGHIWRSKYCVLEQGVLYFYRYQSDAESDEAKAERKMDRGSTISTSPPPTHSPLTSAEKMNIAHSPMPNKLMATANYLGNNTTTDRLWEKRVHLDLVGAVRSAEVEFEPNVFELLAVDEEDTDRLVLKAPEGEMKEWLFQFHHSIAMYVQKLIDQLGTLKAAGGDIHHPGFIAGSRTPPLREKGTVAASFSPRYFHIGSLPTRTPPNITLSHGHGRAPYRRRAEKTSAEKLNGSPQTTPSPDSPGLPFALSSESSNSQPPMVTPFDKQKTQQLIAPFAPAADVSGMVSESSCTPDTTATENDTPKKDEPSSRRSTDRPGSSTQYTPLFKRRGPSMTLEERERKLKETSRKFEPRSQSSTPEIESETESDDERMGERETVFGGCADPRVVAGSILDVEYVPRKASRLGKSRTKPYGCKNNSNVGRSSLRWEVGGVSECGHREFNEDSYILSTDLPESWSPTESHTGSLFAIFDGHAGNHAARFAAEKLPHFLHQAKGEINVEDDIRQAVVALDEEFCRLCSQNGREWDSGATALVAAVVREELIVANVGDSRGVMGCSLKETVTTNHKVEREGWHALPPGDYSGSGQCLWKELSHDHIPARKDERVRIEAANGWVTNETEIPIGQLRRIVMDDQDVIDILRRCLVDGGRVDTEGRAGAPHRQIDISRVCGELQVTRAIGDRDFKAAFNVDQETGGNDVGTASMPPWECPLLLPYPTDHSRKFVGDLVSCMPECQSLQLGGDAVCDEFLVMGCDGLWDVMGGDDAIRIGRDLLFERRLSAKKTASRLAELAIHLGSSDNITVIVVRFFRE